MANSNVVETVKSGVDTVVDSSVNGVNSLVQDGVVTSGIVYDQSMEMLKLIVPYAVTFLSAILIYIVGKFVAKLLSRLVRKFLTKMKFESFIDSTGADTLRETVGVKASYTDIISKIVYYIIYISVIIAVLEKLGLRVVTDAMRDLVAYIPSILVALAVIIVGTMVSNFIKGLINRVAEQGNIAYASTLGNVGYFVSMVFVFMVALSQIGIDLSFLTQNITVFVITFCAIVAVAGAFATKNIATHILATTYLKKSLKKGDTLQTEHVSGKIVDITSTHIVVDTDAGKTFLPAESIFNGTYSVK